MLVNAAPTRLSVMPEWEPSISLARATAALPRPPAGSRRSERSSKLENVEGVRDARALPAPWKDNCKTQRTHCSLGCQTQAGFASSRAAFASAKASVQAAHAAQPVPETSCPLVQQIQLVTRTP
jgi:hypothetical protein